MLSLIPVSFIFIWSCINGGNLRSHNGIISCKEAKPEEGCSVTCGTEFSCINSAIQCPIDSPCNVTCHHHSCDGLIIDAQNSSSLYMEIDAGILQSNITMFFPSSRGSYVCMHGFNDIHITGKFIHKEHPCIHGLMYHNADYPEYCKFSTKLWLCIDDESSQHHENQTINTKHKEKQDQKGES